MNITQTGVLAADVARHGGCVLTITGPTTSPCYGQSTRIVAVSLTLGSTGFQVMAFPNGSVPNANDQFIINGVPFSGTGFGYQPSSGQLNRIYDSVNKVYGPAPIAPDKTHWPTPLLPNDLDNRIPLGGANPDYTAADFQHVLLAAQVYNTVSSTTQTLPSMHRPALINYWINNQTAATWHGLWTANPDLCRRIMMRPIGTMNGIATTDNPDHPNFTGSNPNFEWFRPDQRPLGRGQRRHGVPDSVWVDLGMPVRSIVRRAAVQAVVRHSLRRSRRPHQPQRPRFAGAGRRRLARHVERGRGVVCRRWRPSASGLGFGPAEVSPQYVLNGNQTLYQQLLTGATSGTTNYEGRYGATKVPGTGTLGPIMANKWFEYGQNPSNMTPPTYWSFITTPASATVNDAGSYGSPPDPFGVGVVGLDQAGRPIYAGLKAGHDVLWFRQRHYQQSIRTES